MDPKSRVPHGHVSSLVPLDVSCYVGEQWGDGGVYEGNLKFSFYPKDTDITRHKLLIIVKCTFSSSYLFEGGSQENRSVVQLN